MTYKLLEAVLGGIIIGNRLSCCKGRVVYCKMNTQVVFTTGENESAADG